jgi:hypothetical protein
MYVRESPRARHRAARTSSVRMFCIRDVDPIVS